MKTILALALSLAAGAIVVAQSPATDVRPADLVGSWQQTQQTNDRNGNRQIDPEELKAVRTDSAMVFLKFRLNADGTCQHGDSKSKCRYELEPQGSGRQRLMMFLEGPTPSKENKGIIHSVTKNELILANYGSGSFTFYKRTQ